MLASSTLNATDQGARRYREAVLLCDGRALPGAHSDTRSHQPSAGTRSYGVCNSLMEWALSVMIYSNLQEKCRAP